MPDRVVLKVSALSKRYRTVNAVDGVSFGMESGEIIGILGPNGAGKTTTINMILGLIKPTSGSVEVFGKNLSTDREEISKTTNFSAVYSHLPPNLTVRQNLYVFGLLYDVKSLEKKINSLLGEFDLEKYSGTKTGLLSSGELSRLNLAKAVINEPRLLLLDEPTASLDPSVAQTIRELITRYVARTGAAVLWASHNMKEITTVCKKVFFLSKGKILLSGDPRRLPAEHGKQDLEELFISMAREPLTFER
ncbi:MAG: ABC transporter ATP-binding protein [Nitrospinae bacterium]|nr:ABC transporter ATP-binding protein [Nitrospinota bacterium]